jgi:hypothetical protein
MEVKIPTWAYVIGVLMMLFGVGSLKNDILLISSSDIAGMKNDFTESVHQGFESLGKDSSYTKNQDSTQRAAMTQNLIVFDKLAKVVDDVTYMSPFTKTWTVRFGYMGLPITFLYILGGLFLMIKKNFSIKLALGILSLNMLFAFVRLLVLTNDTSGGLIEIMAKFSTITGIILDAIFLVVILASDRSVYTSTKIPNESL